MAKKGVSKKKDRQKPLTQEEILANEFNKLPKDVQEKLKAIQEKIEKFQKKVLSKFDKYITGIALLPPKNIEQEKKKAEEEKRTMPKEEEEKLKNQINAFVLIDDSDSTKMSKEELLDKLSKIITEQAEEVDKNLVPEIHLLSEVKVSCEDGRYEILETLAQCQPVYDPRDVLGAFKISEVHKKMVLQKFEKYIVAYIGSGSLYRGEKSNDIDVDIIIDDTDVKRMSRAELKDKLRSIIYGMGHEAAQITGVRKQFHIQTYILTDFWEGLKEANPVFFTIIRDGVPLFDRGMFMPWKQLLQMGRVRPSKEAIDLFMSSGEQVIFRVKERLKDLVGTDIYWSTLNPSQAAIMLYGLPPPTPKETIQIMDEIFVKKEKMLEKKYVNILERIRKYYKDLEHGKIKEITGTEIDGLLSDTQDYLKRIQKLFEQIEAKKMKGNIIEMHDTIASIVRDALLFEGVKKVSEEELVKTFKEELVHKGKIPERFARKLSELISAKKRIASLSKTDIEKIRRDGSEFTRFMIEFIQRRRGAELERTKIRVKYGDKYGEIIVLDDFAYITIDLDAKDKEVQKAQVSKDGKIGKVKESSLEELEKAIASVKMPKRVFVKEQIFESIKEIFGNDVEILVNY
ncbi:hypothetical protein JXB27_04110 [Candidatus Woesearchaeota archaeon]|nr:hypothetical protein [Candidatus Woesearchaeota archaeon]